LSSTRSYTVKESGERRVPCEPCPEGSKSKADENTPCKAMDEKICAMWRAVLAVDEARRKLREHIDYLTCEKCKRWAAFLASILDTYSRMATAAETYKVEKDRLIAQLHELVKVLESGESQPKEEQA